MGPVCAADHRRHTARVAAPTGSRKSVAVFQIGTRPARRSSLASSITGALRRGGQPAGRACRVNPTQPVQEGTDVVSVQQPVAGAERDPLKDLYTDWSQIMATTPDLSMRLFRSIFDEWHQPTAEPTDVTYAEDVVGGVPGIWCRPVGAEASRVLLYTHGGGFAVGSAASHRKLAAHFAKALGAQSFVLDYRLAPEHPHPAGLEDAVSAFLALTERGIAPEDITTIGDSAGGNLAVTTALALREQGKPVPGSVIALSPWLDMENKGETLVTNDATDALI